MLLNIFTYLFAALVLTVSVAYSSESLSVRGHPSSTGTAPKNLALSTVNEIHDSELTVVVNKTTHTVMIEDKTKITSDGKPAALSDIKAGMRVRISFIERAGKKVATALDVRSGAGPEAAEPKPAQSQSAPMNRTIPALADRRRAADFPPLRTSQE